MKQRIAILFLVFSAACANVQMFVVQDCDTLYFGTQIPGGGVVSDAEWATFLEEVVTPRFPDGFTVWEANGQWKDSHGVIEHERTHILQIIRPDETKVRQIMDAYKQKFRQDSVMRLHSHVGVAFR